MVRLIVVLLLLASGCVWKKPSGPRGTNYDPNEHKGTQPVEPKHV